MLEFSDFVAEEFVHIAVKRVGPDLVITFTTAPEFLPYSASNVLVKTRNSSIRPAWLHRREVDKLIVGIAAIHTEVIGTAPTAFTETTPALLLP